MSKFLEYLNSRKKMETGKVDATGDRIDPEKMPTHAPKQNGGKAYKCSDGKKPKKAEKGFGDEGDAALKIDKVGKPSLKGPAAAKLPTAEGVRRYGMLPQLREAIGEDPRFMGSVIGDFKRNGLLGILVGELLDHPETYSEMAQVMAHNAYGPKVCRRLVKALQEQVLDQGYDKALLGKGQNPDDQMPMDGEEEDMPEDGTDPNMLPPPDEAGMEGEDGEPELGPDGQPLDPDMQDGEPELGPDGQPLDPDMQMGPDGQPLDPNGMMDPNDPMAQTDDQGNPMMAPPMKQPNPALANLRRAMMRRM